MKEFVFDFLLKMQKRLLAENPFFFFLFNGGTNMSYAVTYKDEHWRNLLGVCSLSADCFQLLPLQ